MIEAMLLLVDEVAAPDLMLSAAAAVTAFIPVVVPFLVFGFRKLIPKIPRIALPFVAMGLGFAIDALAAYTAGGEATPLIGAVLGLAGVGLREIANTWRVHGTSA